MAAGATYTPITTQTLGSSSTSVSLNSISGSYTDLVLIINGNTGGNFDCYLQFNGDTGTNYSYTFLYGDGGAIASARSSNSSVVATGGLYTSGSGKGTVIVNLMNYSNTTTYKTILTRSNSGSYVQARTGLWRSTAAISSIVATMQSGDSYTAGTTFTLYGIAAA
jgi:hypothetical protein